MRREKMQKIARDIYPEDFFRMYDHLSKGNIGRSTTRIIRDRLIKNGRVDAAAACDHWLLVLMVADSTD